MSYYNIFGLPESCDVDLVELDRAYCDLQVRCHPDALAPNAFGLSPVKIEEVNEAFRVLSNPLLSILYFLGGKGFYDQDVSLEKAFLVQVLELQEAVYRGALKELLGLKANVLMRFDAAVVDAISLARSGDYGASVKKAVEAKYLKGVLSAVEMRTDFLGDADGDYGGDD